MKALYEKQLLKTIEKCKKGSRKDFERLYKSYIGFVEHLIKRFFKDPQDVEDLAQEVFIRVFRFIKTYDGRAKFKNWLARITINVCIDKLRRDGRLVLGDDSNNSIEDVSTIEFINKDWAKSPLEQLMLKERRVLLEKALDKLSLDHKIIISLQLEEVSYAEMSEDLGIPEGTVGSRKNEAKKKLRKILWGKVKDK